MKIKKEIFQQIVYSLPKSPYETGGFLGGWGNSVCYCVCDKEKSFYGSYEPNIELLNRTIKEWYDNNIDFLGIYHTHYPSNIYLSKSDELYIRDIMSSVENTTDTLYFPIIIAQKNMYVYKARIYKHNTVIEKDELIIE